MSPKHDIRMDAVEIDAFLRSQRRVIVVGVSSKGAPIATAGQLLYHRGQVAFVLPVDNPLFRLFASDDRACCIVEQFPSYHEIVGVMLHGRVTKRRHEEPEVATFDLKVDKVVSFDFGKLLDA